MKINLELSPFWHGYIDVAKVEKRYNCKFVCETPIKDGEGWRELPSLIFYNEVPHPQGSNYMALSVRMGYDGKTDMVVSDGISATMYNIKGIIDGDEVIYSRYRHDYRVGKTGVWIDGGRDYTRSSGAQMVIMEIINGVLEVVEGGNNEEQV